MAIAKLDAIPQFVSLLRHGSTNAQRHAAGALWQLATTADNKNTMVNSGGIDALVGILLAPDDIVNSTRQVLTKEAAAAVLAELSRSQNTFKVAIANAGGIKPLIELMGCDIPGAQKQAASAIWGMACEPK